MCSGRSIAALARIAWFARVMVKNGLACFCASAGAATTSDASTASEAIDFRITGTSCRSGLRRAGGESRRRPAKPLGAYGSIRVQGQARPARSGEARIVQNGAPDGLRRVPGMSDIRATHPGYFRVTLGLSITWYFFLALGFGLSGPADTRAPSYRVVDAYVPLHAWAAIYLALGAVLLVSILVRRVPHTVVRAGCAFGFALTVFWDGAFIIETIAGTIHTIMIIPALTTLAVFEAAAIVERESGPRLIVRSHGHK